MRDWIRTSDVYLSCVVRCAHDRLRLPQREDRDERRRSGDQREVSRPAWHGKLRRQVGHFRDMRRAFWDGWGHFEAVLRIRIRMFLGLPDPHTDPLVTSTDPDPGPYLFS